MWILISCALAAPMNFSSAMMLAKTSAVTYVGSAGPTRSANPALSRLAACRNARRMRGGRYQVVGHTKTIIIWGLGILFFASAVSINSAIGFMIAMVGVMWYTQLRMREAASKMAAPMPSSGLPPPPPYSPADPSSQAELGLSPVRFYLRAQRAPVPPTRSNACADRFTVACIFIGRTRREAVGKLGTWPLYICLRIPRLCVFLVGQGATLAAAWPAWCRASPARPPASAGSR